VILDSCIGVIFGVGKTGHHYPGSRRTVYVCETMVIRAVAGVPGKANDD